MPVAEIDEARAARLYALAGAGRWSVPKDVWADALRASADRAFKNSDPTPRDLDRYLSALHLEDLALACACALGHDGAWDHFVREYRPILYRAADAIEPGGGVRDIADSLYADLYGVSGRGAGRRSLLLYFHGRASLATWLRSVLAQRYVDRVRARRRTEPLPDDDSTRALASAAPSSEDPERPRYVALLQHALAAAVSQMPARDRLRLSCYYAQGLTLAQIGRLLGEHETTVSRHLARTRRAMREDIENRLRRNAQLTEAQIRACFESVMSDSGSIDLGQMISAEPEGIQADLSGSAGKVSNQDRSR